MYTVQSIVRLDTVYYTGQALQKGFTTLNEFGCETLLHVFIQYRVPSPVQIVEVAEAHFRQVHSVACDFEDAH